jgi:radical SAM superfamily enzyme with C-terminal helix-hairpin-helix motif
MYGWMDWVGVGWLPGTCYWSCVGLKSFCLCTHLDRLLNRSKQNKISQEVKIIYNNNDLMMKFKQSP